MLDLLANLQNLGKLPTGVQVIDLFGQQGACDSLYRWFGSCWGLPASSNRLSRLPEELLTPLVQASGHVIVVQRITDQCQQFELLLFDEPVPSSKDVFQVGLDLA
ncbi:hypothetical protein [Candidatus Amarobacter glycogenicus]|uniref:hypothetical protein n=1 Tax=Candidatus Amarobacter glycogenicus TaxID=3140699 RepID=UPI002A100F8B|nr:hypothetical protein [Dehalococcoidia bacterium]